MSFNYYNKNAEAFIERTYDIDFTYLTDQFLALLPVGASILDLGCGSGRDAGYFMGLGYDVYAIDGSEAMVAYTKKRLGDRVQLATFENFDSDRRFNGIWASASLLHVAPEDMVGMIGKYRDMLQPEGIFFMSFKNREEHFEKDGRHFTCYDEKRLLEVLLQIEGLKVVKIFETVDARPGKEDELWINCFCRRL